MLYVFATALSVWACARWLGLAAGITRIRTFPKGPVRREARRSVVQSASWTVWMTTGAAVAWLAAADVRFTETFGGFVAAVLTISLTAGVAAAMMQPEERTPETIDICRLRKPSG